jgi:nicotinamidase-related amidase
MITIEAQPTPFSFDPAHTALIMIDMQRDFIEPGGAADHGGENVAATQAIVPYVQNAVRFAREHGLQVVHTREGHEPGLSDLNPVKRERSAAAGAEIGAKGPLGRFLVRGERGHDFIDALRPEPGEWVIDKPGFGAFHATDLGERLRIRGISHLIVTGVTTQCCVFSTLREAVDRGYACLTLSDATAAYEWDWHEATLRMIASEGHLFGWISDCPRLLAASREARRR